MSGLAEHDEIAQALGGVVGGTRNEDGETWTCACGEVVENDLALYMHRRHDPKHKEI